MRTSTIVAAILSCALARTTHAQSSGATPPASPGASSKALVQANPLGFLQLGPNVEVQLMVAPGVALSAGFRLISAGLLANLIADDLDLAWTGSVSGYYYFRRNMTGWFVGPRVEIGRSTRTHYTSALAGGAAEFGYRRTRSNGFTWSAGALVGSLNAAYTHKTDPSDTGNERFIFAMGVIGLGFVF